MNSVVTLPITEARRKIFKIADEVQKIGTYFTLTARGIPKVIVMSVAEFESWLETLEVMREFPNLEKDIQEAEKDLASGRYAALEEVLADEGFILADKPRRGYVPSRSRRKGQKKSKKN